MKHTFDDLKRFVIKEAYLSDEVLLEDTRLFEDLGITGADAIEFLIAFGKHFDVDISKFNASDYFNAEGSWLGNSKPKKSLTLKHLMKALISSRLEEGTLN
jgi:hypothetical protein